MNEMGAGQIGSYRYGAIRIPLRCILMTRCRAMRLFA